MVINKQDTNGVKPLLGKGELGYDDYVAGGDVGRVYVGTGSENIALAERLEANMMTKAHFNALAEERKANRAGSGFDSFGYTRINHDAINEGLSTGTAVSGINANEFYLGNGITNYKPTTQTTNYPIINIRGNILKITGINSISTNVINNILLPTAPTIYPYDTVLTAEQIASGVIKHADASNSGLIVNGKFDTDTSGWISASANLTIEAGKLKIANSSAYNGSVRQGFATVIGKKYIVEFEVTSGTHNIGMEIKSVNTGVTGWSIIGSPTGRYTYEYTATSTTTYLLFGVYNNTNGAYGYVGNIAVYPADAISRSDLVFLESWHENISEKNFVYPLGNVQYLGANTDGLTGIANGAFTGFETYSLFGNWQTPSALIGKGYVWSSLTEAQKKAFIANPENNCYLDGDKTIQVRYRVRVAMGLGDNWDYPVAIIDGGGSDTVGSVISYSVAGNKYLKPKGKKVNILNDVTAYNANDTGFFANKNYKTVTTGYESGMATAVATNTTTLDTGVAYEGKCFALPIALVHR